MKKNDNYVFSYSTKFIKLNNIHDTVSFFKEAEKVLQHNPSFVKFVVPVEKMSQSLSTNVKITNWQNFRCFLQASLHFSVKQTNNSQ